jgi:pilus assembly protein CpaB
MNRARRLLILFAAFVLAILAIVLLRGIMAGQPAPPVVEAPVRNTVPVLVAVKDIVTGERINPFSVEWRDWPRENLADFMINREQQPNAINDIEGFRARAPVFVGEPLARRSILSPKDGNLMSALVLEGLRGVGIRVSDRTGGGGFILPNDRVDIISTVRVELRQATESEESKEIVFSRTIITNARVLAVNQSLAPDGDAPNLTNLQTAVVELDPVQAELVVRAEMQGELSLALRSIAESKGDGTSEQRPQLAALSEVPNSVEVYTGNVGRLIFSCEPNCEPALQNVNAPFPLIVRDVGIPEARANR